MVWLLHWRLQLVQAHQNSWQLCSWAHRCRLHILWVLDAACLVESVLETRCNLQLVQSERLLSHFFEMKTHCICKGIRNVSPRRCTKKQLRVSNYCCLSPFTFGSILLWFVSFLRPLHGFSTVGICLEFFFTLGWDLSQAEQSRWQKRWGRISTPA